MVRKPDADTRPLILHVTPGMQVGGISRLLLAVLRQVENSRFQHHVFCTHREGEWAGQVRAMGVPLTLARLRPSGNPLHLAGLRRAIRRIGPDIVHVHNRPNVVPVALACIAPRPIPFIIHYHNGLGNYHTRISRLLLRVESLMTRRAAALLAVSRSTADSNAAGLGFARDRVEVVYNGVDTARFSGAVPHDARGEWGVAPDRPLVITVGRFIGFKTPLLFVEAAAQVLHGWRDGAGPRPVFAMVGEGPLRADCERRAGELGVADGIVFAGTRQDVPALLAGASVAVFTTNECEGFSLALLEYMAAGVPVAAVDVGPVPEAVCNGQHALLSPPGRADLLAANITRLLTDKDLARTLASRAVAERLPLYDWVRVARDYEAVYRRVLRPQAPA